MNEQPIPLDANQRARMLLGRLRQGPASTLDLQKALPLVHVARQVWELRHWYGFGIKTSRLPNNVAVYEIVAEPGTVRQVCPVCSLPLHSLEPTLARSYVTGICTAHGRQTVHA